jgi:hypothetical protein
MRDCSVRALAVASGKSYGECHALFACAGRAPNCGTSVAASRFIHEETLGYKKIDTWTDWMGFPTLHVFVQSHPRGRYILHTRDHAFALIDGVVHDWTNGTGSRGRIVRAWEVT